MKLLDIETLCNSEDNFPHIITQIAIIDACGVLTIPAADVYDPEADPIVTEPHTITDNLTLKAEYAFAKWNFRGKSEATYTATTEGEEDAKVVNASIQGYIPQIAPIKTWLMSKPNGRYIVLFWDRNNADPRLLGEIGNGCHLNVTEQSSPKNGYLLNIQANNLDTFPYFYGGTITYVD